MTETSPLATVSYPSSRSCSDADDDERYRPRGDGRRARAAGRPAHRGDDGSEQPWDGKSVGEIQVRGPFITGSYHEVPSEPDKFTDDGWLRTGDVASVDELGFVRITDRTKDLIKSGGEWISSVDLENALMAHPAIAEAAVIAIPDEKWSERPLACVVFKPGKHGDAPTSSTRTCSRTGFAKWQLPERYEFIDAIPRTSTGKFWKTQAARAVPELRGRL